VDALREGGFVRVSLVAERAGRVVGLKAVRVIFDGNSVTFKHPPGNEEKGPFRLNPTKKPKQIDFGDAARGIYELKEDLETVLGSAGEEEKPADQVRPRQSQKQRALSGSQ